jgi:hypothetical protein
MYVRYKNHELKNPEYKLIVNDDVTIGSNNHLRGDILISLEALQKGECLAPLEKAIADKYSIEDFIDTYFIKRKTTIHPARKAEEINLEFVEVSATPAPEEKLKPEDINKPEDPKIVQLKKGRKLKKLSSFVIEEDVESDQEVSKDTDTGEYEEVELPPKKPKRKTKRKYNITKVNPPGKTKKNKSI